MSEPTLRTRKKQQTRDALVGAAFALAERQGFDGTTIDQMAEAAGVSRRTFFRYFGTKEAVIFARQPDRHAAFRARIAAASETGPYAAIRAGLLAVAAEYMRDRDEVLAQQRIVDASPALIAIESELYAAWEHVIADTLLAGPVTASEDSRRARIVAGAIMGAVRAAYREWIADDGRGDLIAIATELLDTLEHAFDHWTETA